MMSEQRIKFEGEVLNQRIKELADKAEELADEAHSELVEQGVKNLSWVNIYTEKLAEVIIQECLTFVEPMPGSGDIDDLALEGAYNGIKEHFGVK